MKIKLTLEKLQEEAKAFSELESEHDETSIYGSTDGKAVGTYLEHKFKDFLRQKYEFDSGNSASGIDLPELEVDIKVGELFDTVEYDYPNFHLKMYCYLCKISEGNIVLVEHEAAKWLHAYELESVDWLPADLGLIAKIREQML